jgi:hypothetical protein
MDGTILPFDYNNPWVFAIQVALVYILPRVVGLISDKFAAGLAKAFALGVLSVIGSGLTWLLDVAVGGHWETANWTDLITVLVNAGFTWVVAQQVFDRFLKPSGVAAADAERGLSIIPASTKLLTELAARNTPASAAKNGPAKAATAKKAASK